MVFRILFMDVSRQTTCCVQKNSTTGTLGPGVSNIHDLYGHAVWFRL